MQLFLARFSSIQRGSVGDHGPTILENEKGNARWSSDWVRYSEWRLPGTKIVGMDG